MPTSSPSVLWRLLGAIALFLVLGGIAGGLFYWKVGQREAAAAAAAGMPEPAEVVQAAKVVLRPFTPKSTAIGTVKAMRSITLRNELAGTARVVKLSTGQIVAAKELLVELDVAVEQAQLASLEAEARLAKTMLGRMEKARQSQGASAADVDRARAQSDMAAANVKRLEAIIEQKRIRAPFRARVGFVDLHPGQYLDPGTEITTLQGVDESVHVDFAVTQEVAARLKPGVDVEIVTGAGVPPHSAKIVAIDARVDPETRNTSIRAELRGVDPQPAPGASVRVRAPIAAARDVAVVPVSALRRGPGGNTVFVLKADPKGKMRAHVRQVRSGTILGDQVVIEKGLAAGETVATDGSFKLREGALVHVPSPESSAGSKQN